MKPARKKSPSPSQPPQPNPDPKPTPDRDEVKAPRRPASLQELNEICRSKIDALVRTPRGPVTIEIFPLTPREAAMVDDLLGTIIPPFVDGPDGKQTDRLDIHNTEYLKKKDEVTRKARSLGLWWGVPLLRENAPTTIKSTEEIHGWIQSQTTDSVLEQLWTLLAVDCVPGRLEDEVRFFTSPA